MTTYSCLIAMLFAVTTDNLGSSASKSDETATAADKPAVVSEIKESGTEDDDSSITEKEPNQAADDVNWEKLLEYDKGLTDGPRQFKSALYCTYSPMPCVITQDGVLKFNLPEEDRSRLQLDMFVFHDGRVNKVDYLEKNSFHDYVIVERILNRQRNKHVWSLSDRVEQGIFDRLYIYGIKLQYKLDEGDPFVVEMYEHDKPEARKTYFFRYHQSGFRFPFDIALIVPFNSVRIPLRRQSASEEVYDQGMFKPAITMGFTSNRDPDSVYTFWDKVIMAGYPSVFASWVPRSRQTEDNETEYELKDPSAVFMGAGITYFGCLSLGLGYTFGDGVARPFLSLNIGKLIKFIWNINRSSPALWDSYIEKERKRDAAAKN